MGLRDVNEPIAAGVRRHWQWTPLTGRTTISDLPVPPASACLEKRSLGLGTVWCWAQHQQTYISTSIMMPLLRFLEEIADTVLYSTVVIISHESRGAGERLAGVANCLSEKDKPGRLGAKHRRLSAPTFLHGFWSLSWGAQSLDLDSHGNVEKYVPWTS